MRARSFRSVHSVHTALLVALGLPLTACGGQTIASTEETPDGGSSSPDGAATPDATPDSNVVHPNSFRACVDPVAVIVAGVDTGFDTCQGGVVRRRAVVDCPSLLPRPASATFGCTSDAGAGPAGQCAKDGDCSMQAFGACEQSVNSPPGYCYCAYGCTRDSDCASGNICQCGDPVGTCVPASCTSGASCEPGAECATYTTNPGCGGEAFACQEPTDACLRDADCADASPYAESCALQNGARVCSPAMCAIGRPFLVEGEARVAPLAATRDWRGSVTPCTDGLPAETRGRLAAEWARVGQMEHASVAAFARFALQLLAAGAPPHLLEATQRAMADETVHTKLAFGLASAYAGRDIGPGALSIDACLGGNGDLDALLATVIREGCIGETVAAIEAREALEHAQDPVVRAVLATIARDETTHAELAWRTVAWALETGGESARASVESAFAEAIAEVAANGDRGSDDLLVHGVVGESLRATLRVAAIRDAVIPCAKRVLARSLDERVALRATA